MIGVARPTRGLEFTESSQSIERNLKSTPHTIERSWTLELPDCFNETVALLLQSKPKVEAIWFVEEDVVVPNGAFDLLYSELVKGADIAAINYYLKKQEGVLSEYRDEDGNLLQVSLGCTLVKREVFESLPQPWFICGYTIGIRHFGSGCKKRQYLLVKNNYPYGGQDSYFCWKAREAGFKLVSIDGETAEHLILEGLGQPDVNAGLHKIKRVKKTKKE